MLDLIYWLGQISLVELELIGMVAILVLPPVWIIGSIVELLYRLTYKLRVYEILKESHGLYGAAPVLINEKKKGK